MPNSAPKGNYPFAILHEQKVNGTPAAIVLTMKLSKEKLSKKEAIDYVRACVMTSGYPHMIDQYEDNERHAGLAREVCQ